MAEKNNSIDCESWQKYDRYYSSEDGGPDGASFG